MSEPTRRDMLIATALAAPLVPAAQHEHPPSAAPAAESKTAPFKPKLFNPHEYRTLERLCALIVPADEVSKGALEAGAPQFIDLMAASRKELAEMYIGGLAWLDHQMRQRFGARFVDAKPDQQTAMLDLIAYRKNDAPELGPGILFFDWLRKMTVDAFYTSPAGVADLEYKGNSAMTVFEVPATAIAQAVAKSGL